MIEVKVTTCTGCLGGGTWKRQELPLWTWAFKLDTLHPYIHLLSTGSGSRTSSGQWTPTRAFIYGVTTFQIIAHRFCGDPEDKKPKTFHQPVELTRPHEALQLSTCCPVEITIFYLTLLRMLCKQKTIHQTFFPKRAVGNTQILVSA